MSSSIQPKPVRVFSKEQPCTKVELFNCFWDKAKKDWRPRAVVEAQGEIGRNAPLYLLKKGYARTYQRQFVDWYELSESGKPWLLNGLMAHLKRHPEDWGNLSDDPTPLFINEGPEAAFVEVTRIVVRGTKATATVSTESVSRRLTRKR